MSHPRVDESDTSTIPKRQRCHDQLEDATEVAIVDNADISSSNPPTQLPYLHRHALESIFAFLTIEELGRVISTSELWADAVDSMRAANPTLCKEFSRPRHCLDNVAALSLLCVSRIARHIGTLGSAGDDGVVDLGFFAHAEEAEDVALSLENLHTLHIHARGFIPLPPSLTNLSIQAKRSSWIDPGTMEALSTLPLLKSLEIALWAQDHEICFAALKSAPCLTELGFRGWDTDGEDFSMSDEQVDDIRALPHVTILHTYNSLAFLTRLLKQPHELKWQRLDRWDQQYQIDEDFSTMLVTLTSLTAINGTLDCEPTFLTKLINLTEIELQLFNCRDMKDRLESLVSALQCCTKVEVMKLDSCPLNSDQLCKLLPSLPCLRSLALSGCDNLESLVCFTSGPVCRTLTSLKLFHCSNLKLIAAGVQSLHSLLALTHLNLYGSFAGVDTSAFNLQLQNQYRLDEEAKQ